ncbi:MAG TPA: hypothetical protein VHL59_13425 [Thermoanaerobaculia bacterium]|nr:hypothetical protein [Thermoanaerobaculia bacterium]
MTTAPQEAPREEAAPSPQPVVPLDVSPVEEAPPPRPRRRLWNETLTVTSLLIVIGAALLLFTFRTIHRREATVLAKNPSAARTNFSVRYWMDHGYVSSGGLLVHQSGTPPGYHFYLSSTGGNLVTAFLAEKLYSAATGRYSLRLIALQNQLVTLFTAVALGLLAFRLARRGGASPLHAFVFGASLLAVHFTFPDNLGTYWEMNGRPWFLFFAAVFLLLEERSVDGRTRVLTIAQAVCAFFLTWMEYVAGTAFLATYVVATAALASRRVSIRRLLGVVIVPAVLALSLFAGQRAWVRAMHPEAPTSGSTFLFRTGLDGATTYYVDHLDIAYRRDLARLNFPTNSQHLFRWKWMFFAGTAALLIAVAAATRGRVPPMAAVSLLSLLGAYLLYAAVFSQAIVIHPYIFDVLLFTPLALALFVVVPAFFEAMAEQRGVIVVAVFLLAVWLSFVHMRKYAMWYPPPPSVTAPQ